MGLEGSVLTINTASSGKGIARTAIFGSVLPGAAVSPSVLIVDAPRRGWRHRRTGISAAPHELPQSDSDSRARPDLAKPLLSRNHKSQPHDVGTLWYAVRGLRAEIEPRRSRFQKPCNLPNQEKGILWPITLEQ